MKSLAEPQPQIEQVVDNGAALTPLNPAILPGVRDAVFDRQDDEIQKAAKLMPARCNIHDPSVLSPTPANQHPSSQGPSCA